MYSVTLSLISIRKERVKKGKRNWWVLLWAVPGHFCSTCLMKIALAKMCPQACFEK